MNEYYNGLHGTNYLETFTFKADADLRQVLREIAYEQTKASGGKKQVTTSSLIREAIESNPLVASKLQQLKKNKKTA